MSASDCGSPLCWLPDAPGAEADGELDPWLDEEPLDWLLD